MICFVRFGSPSGLEGISQGLQWNSVTPEFVLLISFLLWKNVLLICTFVQILIKNQEFVWNCPVRLHGCGSEPPWDPRAAVAGPRFIRDTRLCSFSHCPVGRARYCQLGLSRWPSSLSFDPKLPDLSVPFPPVHTWFFEPRHRFPLLCWLTWAFTNLSSLRFQLYRILWPQCLLKLWANLVRPTARNPELPAGLAKSLGHEKYNGWAALIRKYKIRNKSEIHAFHFRFGEN